MNKEDFQNRLHDRLRKVPLETRRQWNETDLLIWWGQAVAEDSYLTWERATGGIWQHVKSMCRDLIGPNAR